MTHGSLFSGIGGFELGAKWAGIETLWNCEIEKFQRKILKQHFPKTTQYEDIRELHNPGYVDIISGGFPCQDISINGKVKVLPEKDRDCGRKCTELFGKLDPGTSSLKTAQCFLFEDLKKSYVTFPKAGLMRNGNVYQTTLLDTHTKGKDFILLPTPTKSDFKATYTTKDALTRYLNNGHQIRVSDILAQKGFLKCQRVAILEMAMGFSIGHTELDQ